MESAEKMEVRTTSDDKNKKVVTVPLQAGHKVPVIFIATPAYSGIMPETLTSIDKMVANCRGYIVFYRGYAQSSLVYTARNQLLQSFLQSDADYILWIDADMVLPVDTNIVFKFLGDNKDVVSALAIGKRPPYRPCFAVKEDKGQLMEMVGEGFSYRGLIEVAGVGMAVTMIRRDVIEALVKEHPKGPFNPLAAPGGDIYGEDYSFSIRARRLGFKLYVDADIHVGHIGKKVFWPAHYLYEWQEHDIAQMKKLKKPVDTVIKGVNYGRK